MSPATVSMLVAGVSSVVFGISAALQHRAAASAAMSNFLRPSLLLTLARRPDWLLAMLMGGVGLGLHAVALRHGDIALIQMVLTSSVLVALGATVILERRRPSGREAAGSLLAVTGLALAAGGAHPAVGTSTWSTKPVVLVVVSTVVGALVLLAVARTRRPIVAASLLGLAAGALFAVTALLLKLTAAHHGSPFSSWTLYAFAGVGLFGIVINQSAYQVGPLSAALPPLAVANPALSLVIGAVVFRQFPSDDPGSLALMTLGLVLVVIGLIMVAEQPSAPVVVDDVPQVAAPRP